MDDEAALLSAIVADPADDLPRLAYADWLDERGDPRAEYVRLVVDIASRIDRGEPYDELGGRACAIADGFDPGWRDAVGRRYDVVLDSYPSDTKILTIAAVRYVSGLGLAEAKTLVERPLPVVVCRGLRFETAESHRRDLESGYFVPHMPGRHPRRIEGCCTASLRVGSDRG